MIEQSISTILNGLAQNVYPVAAPLNYQRPAVVFNRISTKTEDDLDGSPTEAWAMIQIDVYDTTQASVFALAKTIRHTLAAHSDVSIKSASLHDERQFVDDTTQTRLYRVSQDWFIYATLD